MTADGSETTKAPAGAPAAALARLAALANAHPEESGCALIEDGHTALVTRLALAEFAAQTLDVQYYLWHDDATGRLLARALLAAADRGIRVRMLIDDIHLAGRDTGFAVLDRHHNISIRIFNPFRVRAWLSWRRLLEVIREGGRLNHRMHNKTFIADGAVAIVGGRNIGDEYFAASQDASFRDMDLLALGPVVPDIGASFQQFWESQLSVPVRKLAPFRHSRRLVRRWYRRLRRARLPRASFSGHTLVPAALAAGLDGLQARLRWGKARIVYDMPDKGGANELLPMAQALRSLAESTRQTLLIETAYFIPNERLLDLFRRLRERNVSITALTNSLASNDVIAAHAGYAVHRTRLLELGINLFEASSRAGSRATTVSGGHVGSRASLHTKAAVIDRKTVFIGTFNLDPRSVYLNTEIGLIVENVQLAQDVSTVIETAMGSEECFRLLLARGGRTRVRWQEADGSELSHEPETTWVRRCLVAIYQRLPIHRWL